MKTILNKFYLLLVFILQLVFIANINAQDRVTKKATNAPESDFNLTLQHTTLVVSNFEESKHFYIEILGLKDLKADWLPKNQMFISLGNNLELHVGEVEGIEIIPSNFNHFAISTNDLDAYLLHLQNQGVLYSSLGGDDQFHIQKRPDGVRQTFIQDPDGYWIEINDSN